MLYSISKQRQKKKNGNLTLGPSTV